MSTVCIAAWIAVLLLLPLILLSRLVETQPERIRRLHRQRGWSQRRIAAALGITRHRVRVALA